MGAQILRDQYTGPLVRSTELGNVIHLFRDALAGKRDRDDRLATSQQIAEDMRRPAAGSKLLAAQGYASALDDVDVHRSSPEYRNTLAIGDARCCPPGPNTSVYCTVDGRRICDYDRIGGMSDDVNGQAVFTVTPQPSASFAWWRPKLVRGFAIDVTNPSIPRWEGDFVTVLTIGDHPVEGFNTAPTIAVRQGVHLGDYVTPDVTGIPVGWADLSNTANANQLVFSGISLWQAGVHQFVFLSVMGNPLKNGEVRRCHPESVPVPPMTGNGSSTGNYRAPGQGSRPM